MRGWRKERRMAESVPSEVAADVPDLIVLASREFADGEVLAQRYTCDGTNTNPPLQWTNVPNGTAELALVVEDPDHAEGTFVHWMVAGLEPDGIGAIEEDKLPETAIVGINDYGDSGYKGPCPPADDLAHRYVFTVIASGVPLGLGERFTAADLAAALEGDVLAKGVLIARYGGRS
jgi:Raf kinase inhibitor-like YbhB/YbcL family protein